MKLQTLLSTYVFTVLLQHSNEEQLSSDSDTYLTVQLLVDMQSPDEQKLDRFFNIDTMIDLSTKQFYFFEDSVTLRLYVPNSLIGYPINFLQFVNNHPYEISFNQTCSTNSNTESFCQQTNSGSRSFKIKGYCCPESVQIRCIFYDPLWYSINTLDDPVIVQGIKIQAFTKEMGGETNVLMKRVAESNRFLVNGKTIEKEDDKLYFTARVHNLVNTTSSTCKNPFCPKLNYLLIPISRVPANTTIPNMGGAREYLLIKKKIFDLRGILCAATGISIGSVFREKDRCSDTFIKVCSPEELSENEGLRNSGVNIKKSKYFLSKFALPVAPYTGKIPGWNSSTTLLFVANEKRPDKAKLEVIINLNKNLFPFAIPLIGKSSIRTIYSHPVADSDNQYEIGISILNTGLVTGSFKVLLNCEPKKQSKTFILMPFQGQIAKFYQSIDLTIERESQNSTSKSTNKKLFPSQCRIQLWNEDDKTVISKELDLEENKTCICLVGCKCSCDLPYKCELTEARPTTEPSIVEDDNEKIWVIVGTLSLILMLFNLLKFTLGFCFPIPVGEAGLCVFILSNYQCKYLEKDIEQKAVEYDEDGYPIHPKCKERVRALQYKTMGALNLLFFFYLPFIAFHWFLVRDRIKKKKKDICWDKLETTVEMVKEGDDNFCLHRTLRRAPCQTVSSDNSDLPDCIQEERNSILEEYGRRIYKGKCREDSVSKSLAESNKLYVKDCQRKSKFKTVFKNFRKTEKEKEGSSFESSDGQKSVMDNLSACRIPDITQTIRDGHESSSSSEPSPCSSIKRTTAKDKCS